MSCTSASPRKVIAVALAVGRQTLPDHPHRCAPRKFTQPQLFACLVLKVFEGWDYRTTEQHLRDLPGLCDMLGLAHVPDHSTLHKAAQRFFGAAISERLLATSVRLTLRRPRQRRLIQCAAVDGTGLESGHPGAAVPTMSRVAPKARKTYEIRGYKPLPTPASPNSRCWWIVPRI